MLHYYYHLYYYHYYHYYYYYYGTTTTTTTTITAIIRLLTFLQVDIETMLRLLALAAQGQTMGSRGSGGTPGTGMSNDRSRYA